MTATLSSNGHSPETTLDDLDELGARIPFGARANQNMPASWAAAILTALADRNPKLFGDLLAEAALGHRPAPPASRRRRGRAADDGPADDDSPADA